MGTGFAGGWGMIPVVVVVLLIVSAMLCGQTKAGAFFASCAVVLAFGWLLL